LPVIGREFQINAILQTWIPTAYLLAAAMFAVPFGRLSEIKGMKKIFVYGNIIFFISFLLSALSPNAIYLIIFRLLQGIGSAMMFVTGLAILTGVYPPMERGKVIGYQHRCSIRWPIPWAGAWRCLNTLYWVEEHIPCNITYNTPL